MNLTLSPETMQKAFALLQDENRRLAATIAKLEARGRPAKVLRERQAKVLAALQRRYAP